MARRKPRFVGKFLQVFRPLRLLAKRRPIALILIAAFSVTLALAPAFSNVAAENAIVANSPDAGALVEQGRTLYEAQKFSDAVKVLQKAVIAYQTTGDKLKQAMALSNLSLAHQQLGQWSQAETAIAQSLNLLKSDRATDQLLAQSLDVRGRLQFLRGNAEKALTNWQESETIYSRLGDKLKLTRNRINSAQALQALGYYRQARKTLTETQQLLQNLPDSELKATGLRSLGNIFRVVGDFKQSRQILSQSLTVAEQIESREAIADTLLDLGNTARAQLNSQEALKYYQQAAASAVSPTTRVQAQLNQLSLLAESDRDREAQALIPQIQTQIAKLSLNRATVYARINFAESLMLLKQKATETISWDEIAQILAQASQQAQELEDRQANSYALGYLGELYERAQQPADAEKLTRQALFIAQTIDAPDTIYLWQWQLGRLLKSQGNLQGAIASYTDAVNNLKSIRNDLVALDREVQFSFRDRVEPVYRQLVDLLLQAEGNAKISQDRLLQARSTIESLQLTEIENFLRSPCLNVQPEAIDRVVDHDDPTTAVIYPIVLPDRLEIVLKLPKEQKLHRYTTKKSQTELESTLVQLQQYLREPDRTNDVEKLSQQVYDWLIRPLEGELQTKPIKTLVFVLDGSLRNIPMSVLYDRQQQQYLIEKYAIALAPGLQLLDLKPLAREELSLLSAGLSEERTVEGQVFPPLENVKLELKQIKSEVAKNEELIDRTFTKTNLRDRINSESFSAVHLATHGQFSSKPEATFILTWDRLLKINELDNLLKNDTGSNASAIELLVLSACETAYGDNRATLGLAGIAVRAGVRSTLATLWSVDDRAISELMSEFYQQIANTNLTKAEALRRAQLSLWNKKDRDWHRPYFWAAYVLVGNWL
jgi:CHAT domain-containing protein